MIGQSGDDWNDDEIQKIFYDSIAKHKTKSGVEFVADEELASSPLKKQKKDVSFSLPNPVERMKSQHPSSSSFRESIAAYSQSSQVKSSKTGPEDHQPTDPFQSNSVLPALVTEQTIDDALQSMLLAWYQSGYATGRYQTLREIFGDPASSHGFHGRDQQSKSDNSSFEQPPDSKEN